MSKNPTADLLVNAYCDLIEAKLPIVGLHQRQFLSDMKSMATSFMNENPNAGLEDLYDRFGDPADTASRLAAVIADPESAEDPITAYYGQPDMGKKSQKVKVHSRKVSEEEAMRLMKDNCNCHKDKHCHCDDEDETHFDDILHAYEIANKMADDGASIADISVMTGIPTTVLYMGGFGDPTADMRDFIIPVRYQMTGLIKVKATSVDDAIATAMNAEGDNPIPEHAHMVPETYEICTDSGKVAMYTDLYRSNKLGHEPTDSGWVSPLENRDEMLENCDDDGLSNILQMLGFKPVHVLEIDPSEFPCINDGDCENCVIMKLTGGCPRFIDDGEDAEHTCDCGHGAAQVDDPVNPEDAEISDQVCFFDDIEELPDECRPMDEPDDED